MTREWRDVRRQPEADREFYALGHYEQMVVDKVIASAINSRDDDLALSPHDRACLRTLQHIFAAHGTVTIVRRAG